MLGTEALVSDLSATSKRWISLFRASLNCYFQICSQRLACCDFGYFPLGLSSSAEADPFILFYFAGKQGSLIFWFQGLNMIDGDAGPPIRLEIPNLFHRSATVESPLCAEHATSTASSSAVVRRERQPTAPVFFHCNSVTSSCVSCTQELPPAAGHLNVDWQRPILSDALLLQIARIAWEKTVIEDPAGLQSCRPRCSTRHRPE